MTRARPFSDLLRLGAGPLIWFAHFSLIYGAEAAMCRPPAPSPGGLLSFGATLTVAALAALGWLAFSEHRRLTSDAFLHGAGLLLAGLAALAVLWTAVPLAVLPGCTAQSADMLDSFAEFAAFVDSDGSLRLEPPRIRRG